MAPTTSPGAHSNQGRATGRHRHRTRVLSSLSNLSSRRHCRIGAVRSPVLHIPAILSGPARAPVRIKAASSRPPIPRPANTLQVQAASTPRVPSIRPARLVSTRPARLGSTHLARLGSTRRVRVDNIRPVRLSRATVMASSRPSEVSRATALVGRPVARIRRLRRPARAAWANGSRSLRWC